MDEAFARTIKRDYIRVSPRPNAGAMMHRLPFWLAHHNKDMRTRLSAIVTS